MRTRFPLLGLFLLLAACASTPQKMPGRYAVMFDSESGRFVIPQREVVRALADRLTNLEIITSATTEPYDAVIVLGVGAVESSPADGVWGGSAQHIRITVYRQGARAVESSVRYDFSRESAGPDQNSEQMQSIHNGSLAVADAVVKTLRNSG